MKDDEFFKTIKVYGDSQLKIMDNGELRDPTEEEAKEIALQMAKKLEGLARDIERLA